MKVEDAVQKPWSREHLVRRVDRYYRLAAAAKRPNLKQHYIRFARRYRHMLSMTHGPDHHQPTGGITA